MSKYVESTELIYDKDSTLLILRDQDGYEIHLGLTENVCCALDVHIAQARAKRAFAKCTIQTK